MVYQIEILNNERDFVAPVQVLAPINTSRDTIFFTYRLSNWGQCKFRVGTKDPLFETVGDVLEPYKYHVRVRREGSIVWQGVIIKNPVRNKRYVEVVAYSYLFLLSKVLLRHDTTGDPNYRTFKTGTMATAVTALINEAKADVTTGAISSLTTGTIDNPNYPAGYTTATGTALTGAWNFSADLTLQYDYRSVFYALNSLAQYPAFDFEITWADATPDTLVFNFKQFIGNRNPQLTFTYGPNGNLVDYNSPRNGERMANSLMGVAADNQYNILHVEKTDNESIGVYGKVQDIAAYADVKNNNALLSRLAEELRLISRPDSEIHLDLNDRAYDFGQYHIGDIITVNIDDFVVQYRDKQRRIVGINVAVSDNGSDHITLITNKPKEGI